MYVIEGSELKEANQEEPGKFYIKGHFDSGRFVNDGGVLGNSELANSETKGTPGWFELSNQKFYSQQTAQAPQSPYVVGYMTDGGFVPSKREVY